VRPVTFAPVAHAAKPFCCVLTPSQVCCGNSPIAPLGKLSVPPVPFPMLASKRGFCDAAGAAEPA